MSHIKRLKISSVTYAKLCSKIPKFPDDMVNMLVQKSKIFWGANMNGICPLACLLDVYFAKLWNKASHNFFCKPQDKCNSRFYFLGPFLVPQAAPLSLQQNSGGKNHISILYIVSYSVLTPATLPVTSTLLQYMTFQLSGKIAQRHYFWKLFIWSILM